MIGIPQGIPICRNPLLKRNHRKRKKYETTRAKTETYLSTTVALAPEGCEPGAAASANRRGHGDRLDVGDGGRAAEHADVGRERRLQSWLTLLAFERFDQRLKKERVFFAFHIWCNAGIKKFPLHIRSQSRVPLLPTFTPQILNAPFAPRTVSSPQMYAPPPR